MKVRSLPQKSIFTFDGECRFCRRWVQRMRKAAFKALSSSPAFRWLFWMYQKVPGFSSVSEWFYDLVSRHRYQL